MVEALPNFRCRAATPVFDQSLVFNQRDSWLEREVYENGSQNLAMEKHHNIISVKAEQASQDLDCWPEVNAHNSTVVVTGQHFGQYMAPTTTLHFTYSTSCTTHVTSSQAFLPQPCFSIDLDYSQPVNQHIQARNLDLFQRSHSLPVTMIDVEKQNCEISNSVFPNASATMMDGYVDSAVFPRGLQC